MKKVERAYASLRERVKTEWVLYLLAFVFVLIADSIGQFKVPVWKGTFIIFPIFYSLFLGVLTGPNLLKILDDKKVKAASGLVGVAILPFVAKLGINAGANISIVISAGPALLLQEFGNLCTIFLAMPIALMLGLKREAIGATHSINRETNLALMQDMFWRGLPGGPGQPLCVHRRRHGGHYLLWLHGLHGRGHGPLPPLCPGHGLRCGGGHSDELRRGGLVRSHACLRRPDCRHGLRQRNHFRCGRNLHGDFHWRAPLQFPVPQAGAHPGPLDQIRQGTCREELRRSAL